MALREAAVDDDGVDDGVNRGGVDEWYAMGLMDGRDRAGSSESAQGRRCCCKTMVLAVDSRIADNICIHYSVFTQPATQSKRFPQKEGCPTCRVLPSQSKGASRIALLACVRRQDPATAATLGRGLNQYNNYRNANNPTSWAVAAGPWRHHGVLEDSKRSMACWGRSHSRRRRFRQRVV